MILTCPACRTRYLTDEASFSPHGRSVRCARCGHSWYQRPDAAGAEADLSGGLTGVMTAPQLMRPEAVLGPRKGGLGVPLFIFVILALVAGTAALYQYRGQVVTAVPQLAWLLGSPAAVPNALDIRNVKIRWADPDSRTRLEVTGEIVNLGQSPEDIPLLRFSLRDGEGTELFVRTAPAPQRHLAPGTASAFVTILEGLPEGAVDITVDFAGASS